MIDDLFWGAIALNLASCGGAIWAMRHSRKGWIKVGVLEERARWLSRIQGGRPLHIEIPGHGTATLGGAASEARE